MFKLLIVNFLYLLSITSVFAQGSIPEDLSKSLPDSVKQEALNATQAILDTTDVQALIDTTNTEPVNEALDSIAEPPAQQGDISTTIQYSARDSIKTEIGTQQVFLYGDAQIEYGDIRLEADQIEINYRTNTLKATYSVDSTGKKRGVPVFSDGPETYETNKIEYNFKTRKAYITGIVTQQGEAFMTGDTVKKNQDDELFIKTARYTTCNLADPHFHIQSNKLKVIPGNKLVSGPFNLHFNKIPTILGFPFGMFPSPKKKTSGVIFPSYGEQRTRGFFLQDFGYYFAVNDYVNLRLTGEVFTKGGWGFTANSNYVKRYAYNGNVNFRYSSFRSGNEEDSLATRTFWVSWSHTPQSRGNSRFSASVNGGSTQFNSLNLLNDVQQQVNSNFTSNVSYSVNFPGTPFNLSTSLRHNQNLVTEEVDLTLPDLSLNMNRIFPFKPKSGSGNKWWQKIGVNYNLNLSNRISNRIGADSIAPFNFDNLPDLLDQASNGIRHTTQASTSIKLLKNFTVTPNFSYTETWYLERLNRTLNNEGEIEVDTLDRFSRFGTWTTGAALTTQIYGTAYFKSGPISAIRHVMTPSISYSYRPDFSDPRFDFFQEFQIEEGQDPQRFSRYSPGNQFIFGGPSSGESQTINFNLQNNIEAKIRKKTDSTDVEEKIKIFDNLSIGTGYNFVADSFNLGNINIGARTTLFKNALNISVNSTIDPYIYLLDSVFIDENGTRQVDQQRVSEFAWNNGRGLGQFTSVRVTLGLNLQGKSSGGADARSNDEIRNGLNENQQREFDYVLANPNDYVDFNVPWTFRANYSVNRSQIGFQDPTISQSLTFSGDVSLTEKLKIGIQSGFDIENGEFTQTSINVSRNLHCWEMNLQWVPFGALESYSFSIFVKSSVLQDLRFNRRRAFADFR
ncbi:MAG: putative LPS assembly protein LptD [Bacteroidota bacterium]